MLLKPPEGGLRTDSVVLNQIRVVDKSRLGRRLGVLKPSTMALVNDGLAISLALVDT